MLEGLLPFFKLIELSYSDDTLRSPSIQESQSCALTNTFKTYV